MKRANCQFANVKLSNLNTVQLAIQKLQWVVLTHPSRVAHRLHHDHVPLLHRQLHSAKGRSSDLFPGSHYEKRVRILDLKVVM